MIYFDHSATTQPYSEVLQTYQEVATKIYGNPSSLHRLGSQASRVLDASRRQIAQLLGKSPEEILFTSGGTESDNWAIKGVALEKSAYGKHIIISAVEHPAVRASAQWLVSQGFRVDFAPVDERGLVKLDDLENLLSDDTILVSIMAVNNEMGAIQPIESIADLLADKPSITFHVDAVQAVGHLSKERYLPERVDMASFSGHKFHSVRGVGFLYKKAGKRLTPLLTGGGQEFELRSTTENLPAIAATAKALRLVLDNEEVKRQKLAGFRQALAEGLSSYPDVTLFSGLGDDFAPHILTFGVKSLRGEVLLHALEEHDIFVSTTSACSSKAGQPAGSLIAMGIPVKQAQTAVRISLGEGNDMSQVEQFLTIFKQIYQQTAKVR